MFKVRKQYKTISHINKQRKPTLQSYYEWIQFCGIFIFIFLIGIQLYHHMTINPKNIDSISMTAPSISSRQTLSQSASTKQTFILQQDPIKTVHNQYNTKTDVALQILRNLQPLACVYQGKVFEKLIKALKKKKRQNLNLLVLAELLRATFVTTLNTPTALQFDKALRHAQSDITMYYSKADWLQIIELTKTMISKTGINTYLPVSMLPASETDLQKLMTENKNENGWIFTITEGDDKSFLRIIKNNELEATGISMRIWNRDATKNQYAVIVRDWLYPQACVWILWIGRDQYILPKDVDLRDPDCDAKDINEYVDLANKFVIENIFEESSIGTVDIETIAVQRQTFQDGLKENAFTEQNAGKVLEAAFVIVKRLSGFFTKTKNFFTNTDGKRRVGKLVSVRDRVYVNIYDIDGNFKSQVTVKASEDLGGNRWKIETWEEGNLLITFSSEQIKSEWIAWFET